MRKILVLLILLLVILFSRAEEPEKVIKNLEEIAPYWEEYVKVCNNDSTLYVYWIMTGKEKIEYATDTTIIPGVKSKVAIIQPTMKKEWIKETPTMDGLKKYLEKL